VYIFGGAEEVEELGPLYRHELRHVAPRTNDLIRIQLTFTPPSLVTMCSKVISEALEDDDFEKEEGEEDEEKEEEGIEVVEVRSRKRKWSAEDKMAFLRDSMAVLPPELITEIGYVHPDTLSKVFIDNE
jgi:hypothetical protein